MQTTSPQPTALPPKPAPSPDTLKVSEPVQSTALLKGRKTLLIEHNGAFYRLQTTKLGKLILTK